MRNSETSSRGTEWGNFLLSGAFRRGFADKRAGLPFCPEYDQRSVAWQWGYEEGRQFAGSSHSRRWRKLTTETNVSKALIKAYRRACADRDVQCEWQVAA